MGFSLKLRWQPVAFGGRASQCGHSGRSGCVGLAQQRCGSGVGVGNRTTLNIPPPESLTLEKLEKKHL